MAATISEHRRAQKEYKLSANFGGRCRRSLKFVSSSTVNTSDHIRMSIRLGTRLADISIIKSSVPGPKPHEVWFWPCIAGQ